MLRNIYLLMLCLGIAISGSVGNASDIEVDGQTNDWKGTAEEGQLEIDSEEAIWIDYIDDDKGDGDYTYPTYADSPTWQGGTAYDIEEVRITTDDEYMYFLVTAGGPHLVTYGIFIDTGPGGKEDIFFRGSDPPPADPLAKPHIKLASGVAWDVAALVCQSGGGSGHRSLLNVTFDAGNNFQIIKEWEEFGACCGEATGDVFYSPEERVMELRLPIASAPGATDGIPDPSNKTYHFIILIGLGQVNVPPKGLVAFGVVSANNSEWSPGGADNANAPYVFDTIGSTPEEQQADLSGYTSDEVTTLRHSVISIEFNAQGEPARVGTISVQPRDKSSVTWGHIKTSH
jgi:hypothetical protein